MICGRAVLLRIKNGRDTWLGRVPSLKAVIEPLGVHLSLSVRDKRSGCTLALERQDQVCACVSYKQTPARSSDTVQSQAGVAIHTIDEREVEPAIT